MVLHCTCCCYYMVLHCNWGTLWMVFGKRIYLSLSMHIYLFSHCFSCIFPLCLLNLAVSTMVLGHLMTTETCGHLCFPGSCSQTSVILSTNRLHCVVLWFYSPVSFSKTTCVGILLDPISKHFHNYNSYGVFQFTSFYYFSSKNCSEGTICIFKFVIFTDRSWEFNNRS